MFVYEQRKVFRHRADIVAYGQPSVIGANSQDRGVILVHQTSF